MPLMVFVKVNGEETKLDFDDYEELATVMIERYDGDGVNDAPGSPLIKYWSLGGSEMNTGVAQGVPVEDRKWPLTEAQTAEYVKIGYDIVKELHPEFRAKLGGSSAVNSWQQDGIDDYYYNLASELTGSNKCSDLIFDYHQGSNPFQFKRQIECMNIVDETLNEFGYNGNEIWTTDCGGSWEEWQGFTEAEQAGDVIRRYAYTIANGQEKLFWTRVEEYNWTPDDSSMFDYMGLVHNPANNGGEDWKKLSYYAYKLMVGKLEGSAWDNIETVINGTDNVYAYKFTNKDTGEPVYVAWWDYFDEPGYTSGDTKTITLSGLTGTAITVTNAVPAAESGLDVTDYTTAFTITTYPVADGSSTIVLGEAPVFVEMFNIDIQANGSDGPLSITPNDALSVTVELDPGNNSEINADWWLAADTPFGWFYFDALTWSWTHVFTYAYQGALFELNPPFEVLDISELQTGAYTFYFAVDIDMNGTLDEPLYYDSVLVNVLD